jgi:hypothetical protein
MLPGNRPHEVPGVSDMQPGGIADSLRVRTRGAVFQKHKMPPSMASARDHHDV